MLYILLADGFEEVEAVAPLDILRRAELAVKTVGVTGKQVTGAHQIEVTADLTIDELPDALPDGVILPGGMPGTLNLQKSEAVQRLLEGCRDAGKLIAAICAAPMIIGELRMLEGRKATCFPGFEDSLLGAEILDEGIVRDGHFLTARGAGVALQFGAAIVDYFITSEHGSKGDRLLAQIQLR